MKHHRLSISSKAIALGVAVVVLMAPAGVSAAASSATVREAQKIMTKFGLPTGPIDGVSGSQTARALCAFRVIAGKSASRKGLDTSLLTTMRSYDKKYSKLNAIPAPTKSGHKTYLIAQETCQVMLYAENGRYVRVMAISSGMKGYGTPNGTYMLGNTQRGWSCSTLYPESCRTQTTGRFKGISNYGNMYNKRQIKGNYLVHGSTSVPTYPASHGCVRVTIADSDWMFDHVGNNGKVYMQVTGAY